MTVIQEPSDEYYEYIYNIHRTALWYVMLTPELRYDEDLAYCPKCSAPMDWQEFNNSEVGRFFNANCTNSECGYTDGS